MQAVNTVDDIDPGIVAPSKPISEPSSPNPAYELKLRFESVLQAIVATGDEMQLIKPSLKLVFNRELLDDRLARLDQYAEDLQHLDQELHRITRDAYSPEKSLAEIRQYSALFAFGASVHEALYKAYQIIQVLRDKLNLVSVFGMVAMGALAAIAAIFIYTNGFAALAASLSF